mmetsp:Transcript_48032/g.35239  ORF Transcript_48032/g.35239 Transcript_48032/m.35239 type:complete len:97 (+) Transcript_48032:460-750(+)
MINAAYANKNIVKYFSRYLEDFRREMQKQKELVLNDIQSIAIPEKLNKQALVNMAPNPFTKTFGITKNSPLTAESIMQSKQPSPYSKERPSKDTIP